MKHAFYFSSRTGLMWAWRGVGGGLGVLIRALEVEWVQSYKTEIIRVEGKGALRNRGPWFHSFFRWACSSTLFVALLLYSEEEESAPPKINPFSVMFLLMDPRHVITAHRISRNLSPFPENSSEHSETKLTHRSTASYFVREKTFFW